MLGLFKDKEIEKLYNELGIPGLAVRTDYLMLDKQISYVLKNSKLIKNGYKKMKIRLTEQMNNFHGMFHLGP